MQFQPYYVLRRPLLPIQTYFAIQEQLRRGEALTDVLRPHYENPLILNALYFASAEVYQQCQQWLLGQSVPTDKLLRTLYRYLVRMSTRATPFGQCSGIAVGEWGTVTGVAFEPDLPIQSYVRLDGQALQKVLQAASEWPGMPPLIRYQTNSTTYIAGTDLRYVEVNWRNPTLGRYVLSITTNNAYLQRVLAAAQTGATRPELVAVLTREGIQPFDADTFLQHLIDNQLLLSEFGPTLTNRTELDRLLDYMSSVVLPPDTAPVKVLRQIAAQIPNASVADCLALKQTLGPWLDTPPAHWVQADSHFPTQQNTLGAGLRKSLHTTLERLLCFNRSAQSPHLNTFRQQFYERYEEQEVPLLLALDPDIGVGYGGSTMTSTLLDGIQWPDTGGNEPPFLARHQAMLRYYTEAMRKEEPLLRLTDVDLAALTDAQTDAPLPASGYWLGHLMADSAAAADAGQWLFHLVAGAGPSAANLLGRMAHLDPALAAHLQTTIRQEEATDPNALWAEVVHIPEARMVNVLSRPALRTYEIPILSGSGVADDYQIPLDDLLISVPNGQQVVLRSRRLGKRVIPRLSTAHNFAQGLAHYRFLCDLQTQTGGLRVTWDWGPLAQLPHLPQVRYQNVILSRASWRLTIDSCQPHRSDWVTAWRTTYRVPRYIFLTEADNELPLDLDNAMGVSLLTDELIKRGSIQVKEWLMHERTCWAGHTPDQRWVSELILPIAFPVSPSVARVSAQPTCTVRRSFPPGSEWTYLKIITGEQATEQLLVQEVPELVAGLHSAGVLRQWFFVRYNTPEPHLRLRFQSFSQQDAALLQHILAWVQTLSPDVNGAVRVQLDTYHREVERYGPERMLTCETWFCRESELVLPVLKAVQKLGEEVRLYCACALVNQLLEVWQLTLSQRERLLSHCHQTFSHEFRADKALLVQLDQHYRRVRPLVHNAIIAFDPPPELHEVFKKAKIELVVLAAQLRATLEMVGFIGTQTCLTSQDYEGPEHPKNTSKVRRRL